MEKGIRDMPSHKTELKHKDAFRPAPLLIFQLQSYARFSAIETNVFNYIVLESINVFQKKGESSSDARKWIYVSPSDFALERGHSRQGVQDALNKMVKYDWVLSREVWIKTSGGVQKGREYQLVSNFKLSEICDLLCVSAKPKGSNSELHPLEVKKVKGCRPELAPCKAGVGTLTARSWHLVRPGLAPWGIKTTKSLDNLVAKDSLNTIKEFINTFLNFENSFYEYHSSTLKIGSKFSHAKTQTFKMEMKIASLIRRYGLFSTYTAMFACMFNKDAQIGDIDLVEEFLKTNSDKFKDHEQNLILQCDNLFQEIYELYLLVSENTELENIKNVFRAKASLLLSEKVIELRSIGIFFYNDYENELLDTFMESNWKVQRFTKNWITKLNLYFKAKLLGHKGLNFVQSSDD